MRLPPLLRRALLPCCACAALLAALPAAAADPYPTRPIRMIVPYAAGGNTDVLARLLAQRLSVPLGQQVLVDNRPGGNTLIGTEAVAKAPGDGYTIMLTTLTFSVIPSLYPKLPFDTLKDFTPISLAVTLPNVLVVNPAVPADTLKAFIAYARTNPDKLNYASTGSGTSPQLSMELLKQMAGVNVTEIFYKGGAPAMTDLLGGQVQAQFIGLPVAIPMIETGRLRALGVTSKTRSTAAPTLPAIAETLPGYEVNAWFGILGPARLPEEITTKLQAEIARILRSPDIKDQLNKLGAEPVGSTHTEFAAQLQGEIAQYAKLVKEARIKLQ
jgi:tripartite-type tricarboxylate transporter receptor subunit TctC